MRIFSFFENFLSERQAGIEAGNTLVRVNEWKIEAIQKWEVSLDNIGQLTINVGLLDDK